MRTILLSTALLASCTLFAQTEVLLGSFPFSDGNHPTAVVTFENAEADAVESWYKSQLKEASKDVSNKKELRASGVRVPEVSQDTITMVCKAEQGKKSPRVQLHLGYRVNGAWVSSASAPELVEGAKKHAYTLAVRYKKELLTAALETEKKNKLRLENELADLVKEKGRAEGSIEKTRQKGVEAGQEKLQAEADLKSNETTIAAKSAAMGAAPTEAQTKELQDLIKDQGKLKDKIEKEGKAIVDGEKKVKDLEQEVKDNLAAQASKRSAIEAQAEKVKAAQKALEEVK